MNQLAALLAAGLWAVAILVASFYYGHWRFVLVIVTLFCVYGLMYFGFLLMFIGIRGIQDAVAKYRAARHEQ